MLPRLLSDSELVLALLSINKERESERFPWKMHKCRLSLSLSPSGFARGSRVRIFPGGVSFWRAPATRVAVPRRFRGGISARSDFGWISMSLRMRALGQSINTRACVSFFDGTQADGNSAVRDDTFGSLREVRPKSVPAAEDLRSSINLRMDTCVFLERGWPRLDTRQDALRLSISRGKSIFQTQFLGPSPLGTAGTLRSNWNCGFNKQRGNF